MPKRKGKKKAPKAVQSENSSVAGSETATVVSDFSADLWEPEESSIEDVIKDLCEQLTEKRTSTRVNALTKLSKLLRSRYLPDEVEALLMTLQSRLSSTMRAKDSKEVKLGCLVMGLTAFSTIDILSEDIRRVLTTVAGDSTKRASIRAAALRTVALHAFLDNDEVEKDTILALAQSLFKSKLGELSTAATETWTLLASTMSDAVLANTLFQRADGLIELLESKDIDTKENAGRAIAMLFEATYSEEDNLDKKQAKHLERLIDTITGMLDAMASVSTKSQNKKDNKRQRLSFRQCLKTIEDFSFPKETIYLSSNEIHLDGWKKNVQINQFRRWLGVGLQTHLKENPLLAEILGYRLEEFSREDVKWNREDAIHKSKINARLRKDKVLKGRALKTAALTEFSDP
ncbi:hypothetical protein AAMO2058_000414100 [Amorphochlora amoebiformis]